MKLKILLLIALGMITQTFNTFGQIKSEDLNKLATQARSKFGLPAVAVVLMNSDSVLQTEVQGVRIYDKTNEVSKESFFHIGSCSKSILSVIAAKLIEENKVNWNTKFFTIYPELKDIAHKDYLNITLEDLFLCKAGIKGYTSGNEVFPELDMESSNYRFNFVKWLLKQQPITKLQGEKFQFYYSNASYTMASLMLEGVSGLSYEEMIEKFIVAEMGIETFIGFPNRLAPEQPWGHMMAKNGVVLFSPEHKYQLSKLISPAGDLSMQPEGFAKFIQLSLGGLIGKDNFLKSESYRYIHFAHKGFSIGVANSKMFGYNVSGMDGTAGTFFCRAVLIPESDFAFTIMTNAGSDTGKMKAVDWITMKIVKKYNNWWWKFWM
jgi:D-alanyl-D-alanine carboxypeptidase